MNNYFDKNGNYINCENLSLAEIYHRAFALGVESVVIEGKVVNENLTTCEGQEVGFKKVEYVFERVKLIQETVDCIRNTFNLDTESDKLVRNCMALVQNAIDGEYHDMEEVDVEKIERPQPVGNSDRLQGEWIPITYRSLTEEEEKELCEEWGIEELEDWEKRVFTCSLPDDGQEILVSSYGEYVQEDICSWDEYGCGLENNGDWDGIDAWMPKPKPYKEGGAE